MSWQVKRAHRLLRGLGRVPYAVLCNLRKADAKGRRRSVTSCVVARYLESKGLPVYDISPSTRQLRLYGAEGLSVVDMPDPVVLVAERFDAGHYPDLEVAS